MIDKAKAADALSLLRTVKRGIEIAQCDTVEDVRTFLDGMIQAAEQASGDYDTPPANG